MQKRKIRRPDIPAELIKERAHLTETEQKLASAEERRRSLLIENDAAGLDAIDAEIVAVKTAAGRSRERIAELEKAQAAEDFRRQEREDRARKDKARSLRTKFDDA